VRKNTGKPFKIMSNASVTLKFVMKILAKAVLALFASVALSNAFARPLFVICREFAVLPRFVFNLSSILFLSYSLLQFAKSQAQALMLLFVI
jgi:hypothetical protein